MGRVGRMTPSSRLIIGPMVNGNTGILRTASARAMLVPCYWLIVCIWQGQPGWQNDLSGGSVRHIVESKPHAAPSNMATRV